jgi:hypothetical protein
MLEKILTDMDKAVADLRSRLEDYLKTLGNLNNRNWEADVKKAKSKAMLAVTVANAQLKVLETELGKLGGTGAGRKEIADKLLRISAAQERLKLAINKAENVLQEQPIQST